MTNCILLRYDSLTIRNFCRWKENSVSRGEAMRKRRGHPSSFCVAQSGFLNNVTKWIVSIETVGDEAEGGTWEESATRRGDINFSLFTDLLYPFYSSTTHLLYPTSASSEKPVSRGEARKKRRGSLFMSLVVFVTLYVCLCWWYASL